MIKSLHFVTALSDKGGVQQLLYTYASHLVNEINFDFIVQMHSDSQLVGRFNNLGSKIYELKPIREIGIKKYIQLLKETIRNLPSYDIIHIHMGYKSFIPLYFFKKYFKNIPVIVHIHSAVIGDSIINKIIKSLAVMYIKRKADDFFACGEKAAFYFYGKNFTKKHHVFIMPNAIETDKFIFDKSKGTEIRHQLNIEKKRIYGHVGTFYSPKNHDFLIDIFNELQKEDESAVLLLVGAGELLDKIKKKVLDLGLSEKVVFAGIRQNVSDFLSAFDYFILPSIYEGVPVSIIEAQSAGLKCFVSDSVTKEINIIGDIDYIPLQEGAKKWAKRIMSSTVNNEELRMKKNKEMKKSIYNIECSSSLLLNRYNNIIYK